MSRGCWSRAVFCANAAQALTQDLTSQFAITRSGLVLNRTTNTFDSTVTLKNSSGAPVLAPIDVVVGGLPAGVTLANKTGDKPDGRPYVSPMAAGSQLAERSVRCRSCSSSPIPRACPSPARCRSCETSSRRRRTPRRCSAWSRPAEPSAHLIGRVDGAPNQDVDAAGVLRRHLRARARSSPVRPAATVTARTDRDGYFGVDVAGVNPGAFVTLNDVAGGKPRRRSCQVSSRDNDSWPKAFLLDGHRRRRRSDFIDAPGKARWYKFAVTPGQRIDITLSRAPGRLRPRGVQGHRPGVREPVQSGDGGTVGSPEAHRRVRAVDVQPVDVLAVDLQPVDVQPGRVQPVDVQPVDVLAVGVQPVDVLAVDVQPVDVQPVDVLARRRSARRRSAPRRFQPVDVLAVDLQRDGDRAGVLDRADAKHRRRLRHARA